jgi:hypothetical protein
VNQEENFKLEEWEAAVGKVVTSVVRVEGELLLKYEEHLSRKMYFKEDVTVAKRLNRVESLYNEICGQTSQSDKLFSAFREQVKLRNLVAHNPVYYDNKSGGFRITNSQSRSKFVEVAILQEDAKQAFRCCTELTVLLRVWAKNKS